MATDSDYVHLYHALEIAKIRRGSCAPNPSVGAVIVSKSDEILSTGLHMGSGLPHAEIDALQKLGMKAEGATAYVTLEPCCHWGKTPPCTDALISAGVKRVVYGYRDPNPQINGKGEYALHYAGVECEHVATPEMDTFYESYHYWQKTQLPFITAKLALSLNGAIADNQGNPIQLTGPALGEFTHLFRKNSDGILTTINTIIKDDPQLNARCQKQIIAKPLYILDSMLRLPINAKVFSTALSITIFHSSSANIEAQRQLTQLGARCIVVDSKTEQGLDLTQVIRWIAKDGTHDLWVEAGGMCFASFVKEKLLQRAFVYIAPRWIVDGQLAFPTHLPFELGVNNISWQQHGNDVLGEIRW